MSDKTRPTPGPWTWRSEDLRGGRYYTVNRHGADDPEPIDLHEDDNGETDARLIATAGTAAHEVAQMGYDPVEWIKALPLIVRAADGVPWGEMDCGCEWPDALPEDQCLNCLLQTLLNSAAGKEGARHG